MSNGLKDSRDHERERSRSKRSNNYRNISYKYTSYRRLSHKGSMSHPLSPFRVDSVFRIQSASLIFRPRQPFSLSTTLALFQSILWPSTMAWFAATDRSALSSHASGRCSATLPRVVLPVSPMYDASQSRQWGLFTKWRMSGSAGHFCTRVHAGCMAGCLRPRKTHLRRTTFCSFCLNTLRVILTDDLRVRRTWKIKPEKELEQDFSIFSDRWQWDSEQRTTLQTGLYGDTDCGCRWQATPSLGFCFPHRKGFHTYLAFWLFWLCVCGYWLLSCTVLRPPLVCQIWLTRYGSVQRQELGNCSWYSALHRSTIKLDEKEVFLEVEDTLGPLRL